MPVGGDARRWRLGDRKKGEVLPEFKADFLKLAEQAKSDAASAPDDAASICAAALQSELLMFMKRAQAGSVREVEFEVIPRNGDEVVELKYPRCDDQGRGLRSLFGWHYRLYAGAPSGILAQWLVWALAGRKRDARLDVAWKTRQDDHITTAFARFRRWIISRCDL